MSSSLVARRGVLTALTVLAASALLLLGLAQGNAGAAETKGNAVVTLKTSKLGKATAVAPAKGKRVGKKGVKATASVKSLSFVGSTAKVALAGGIKLANGKRSVKITGLSLTVGKGQTVVRGKLGKKNLVVFTANGKTNVDAAGKTVKLTAAKLTLPKSVGKKIKRALKLKKAPSGKVGSLNLNASISKDVDPGTDCSVTPTAPGCPSVDPCVANPNGAGCPIVDPYLAQCNVAASAKLTGALTPASAIPTLPGAKTVVPGTFAWGLKQSFRSYVVFGASGSLKAANGAAAVGGPPVISAFSFPTTNGQYSVGDAIDVSDDKAVVNGSGTALFCATGHEFRVAVSNPTLVIDGENSRIVADVDTNLSGNWTPTQRVDLAKLDVDGIEPAYNKSGSEVTWSNIPATLTDAGAKAICGVGANVACSYVEGTELDEVNATVNTPYDTGAGDAAAWDALATYVEIDLPYPNPDPATGGCEVGVPTQSVTPTSGNARTIDEHVALGGTTTSWSATPTTAVAAPALTGTAVTGGGFDWGFRRSLRASLNSTGNFNVAGGASASDPVYYGNGGTLGQRGAGVFTPGNMGDTGDFFTWPTASGTYDANSAGDADDQLVLRTEGTVAFCQTQSAQRYGITFSDPTVIIDGANSRITIDATARYRLSWVRATVDFATIDLTGITIGSNSAGGVTTKTWTFPDATGSPAVGPISLTTNGERIAKMLSSAYVAGLGLDGATIRASFPE